MGSDTIKRQDGNDSIRGGEGDDTILGGAGNDVLLGDREKIDGTSVPQKRRMATVTKMASARRANSSTGAVFGAKVAGKAKQWVTSPFSCSGSTGRPFRILHTSQVPSNELLGDIAA